MTETDLLSGSLPGNRLGGLPGRLRIPQIVVPEGLERVIELIDQGNPCRDVQLDNGLIRDAVKVFHKRAQGIPVRDDQDALARL